MTRPEAEMTDGAQGRTQRDPLDNLAGRLDALLERLREVARDRNDLQGLAARERESAAELAAAAERESALAQRARESGRALRRAVAEALEELRAG